MRTRLTHGVFFCVCCTIIGEKKDSEQEKKDSEQEKKDSEQEKK